VRKARCSGLAPPGEAAEVEVSLDLLQPVSTRLERAMPVRMVAIFMGRFGEGGV